MFPYFNFHKFKFMSRIRDLKKISNGLKLLIFVQFQKEHLEILLFKHAFRT